MKQLEGTYNEVVMTVFNYVGSTILAFAWTNWEKQ